ncbi:MAG: efflux RND transporter periplasmic adaptor subunit [Maricaulaceae bacterium]
MHSSDTHSAPKSGFLRKFLVIVIPILIIVAAFIAMSAMASMKKPPAVSKRKNPVLAVMATEAYMGSPVLDVRVQGQTRPRTEVDMSPQVGGKIVYVSQQFVAGGVFKKGEVLLRLETADYNVAVVRAEAGLARAEQAVIREQAEGEIARQDWADMGRTSAPSDLTLRKPQLAEAKANMLSAQADLDNAKLQLSRTVIRAPFNGRIRDRFADIGQFVGPGTRLARVFSTDAIEIPLSLSDADLTRLEIPISMTPNSPDAPEVKISAVIAGKLRHWQGKIVRTDGAFNPQTRTFSAIAEVKDPAGAGASEDGIPLPSGLFVDADIVGKALENVVIIPRDALRPENKVYVVNDKAEAQSRDAVVLDTNSERAVLASGVSAGELVIVSPLEKSQLSLTFKVLDVNDPSVVLIEPPKKEEPKTDEAEDDGKKKKRSKRRKKKDEAKKKKKSSEESADVVKGQK